MNRRRALSASAMSGGGGGGIIDNYLTIVALENGLTAQLSVNACEYCVDGDGNWKSLPAATNTKTINKGQTLSFRGNLTPNGSKGIGTFTISKSCNLEGNCMSMLFGDDAVNNNSLSGKSYTFCRLFYNCTGVKSVSSNFLPATTLAEDCYYYMFYGCTSLTQAPALSATTLANYCYRSMFRGCTSLTQAPALPATILASYCYNFMFSNCTSLTTAPELPATTLANHCYYSMFQGCTSLTQAPALPATTLRSNCYYSMFQGCTSLTQSPALPATTLVSNCYQYMFYDCTKLNYIKAMFTTTPSSSYTGNWVSGVASTGKFIKNKKATWNVTGVNGIPSGWTVVNDNEESGVNEITFYIDDGGYVTPMKALSNMTWGEFVNSEYANQNSMFTNFRLFDYGSYSAIGFYHEEAMQDMTFYYDTDHYNNVADYDVIEDGKTYYVW